MQNLRKIILSKLSLQGLFQVLGISLAVVIFSLLRSNLGEIEYETIKEGILTLSVFQVLQAVALTVCSFLILSWVEYDNYKKMGITNLTSRSSFFISWTSNSLSNYVSFAGLSGATTRLRLLKSWDIDIKKGLPPIVLNSIYLWSGYSLLSFFAILFFDLPSIKDFSLPSHSRLILILVNGLALTVFGLLFFHSQAGNWIKMKFNFQMPDFQYSLRQTLLTAADWCVSAAVLYILLPPSYALGFGGFLTIFLSAQLLGMISHVPGGLGIVEASIIATHQGVSSTELLGPLVFYRMIFYLFPLSLALFSLLGFELKKQSPMFIRSLNFLFSRLTNFIPIAISIFVFTIGASLLTANILSLDPLSELFLTSIAPVQMMNTSYFYTNMWSLFLMVLAFGLYRKSSFSWLLTTFTMSVALIVSFVQGLRMVECSVLITSLLLMLYFRRSFYRKARALTARFTLPWVLVSLMMTLGLYGILLASKESIHEKYLVEVSVLFVALSLHWLGSPIEIPTLPTGKNRVLDQDYFVESLSSVVAQSSFTNAQLAFVGDKRFFFNQDKTSFVMYASRGKTWVSMGDPIGPAQIDRELIRKFVSTADSFGCSSLFYQIRHDQLSIYHDLGFKLIKVGEEARVQLSKFSLEGRNKKSLRNAINRMEAENVEFKILNPTESLERWDEMAAVSDSWLKKTGSKEKGFSLGYFEKTYQSRHSHAVLIKNEKIVAFANIWATADKNELSVDLMRYSEEAPPGAIDCLFVKMLQFGNEHAYTWFNLGMAPLAGLEESVSTPIWNVIGTFLYENGDRFYNFQGIQKFKQKFSPEWESRYIAIKTEFNVVGSIVDLTFLISKTREKAAA